MKLFIMQAGCMNVPDLSYMTPGRNLGSPITIPVGMYLIDHPKGAVLFDTGLDQSHWPQSMLSLGQYDPQFRIDRQLTRFGYDIEDIRYVVLSHMHLDHAGGMALFPNATFVIRKQELIDAWWPETFEGGYLFEDYQDTREFKFIQLPDNEDFDLYDDGAMVCIDTRGHTPGHQSLVVDLPNSGKFVLAGDAVQLMAHITERGVLPGVSWNCIDAMRSIEKLGHMHAEGRFVIPGHDPDIWKTLKKMPDYYD